MDYPAQTPQQLAQVLRGFRRRKQLTQSEAARKAGLLQKTISTLEVMPERATVESLFRLLSALQVEFVLRDKDAVPSSPTQW
jgi:HTH-type transcriptional regulator / antitoxin HipB